MFRLPSADRKPERPQRRSTHLLQLRRRRRRRRPWSWSAGQGWESGVEFRPASDQSETSSPTTGSWLSFTSSITADLQSSKSILEQAQFHNEQAEALGPTDWGRGKRTGGEGFLPYLLIGSIRNSISSPPAKSSPRSISGAEHAAHQN